MKAIFYRNFQYEKWYYLSYFILFSLSIISTFKIPYIVDDLLSYVKFWFIGCMSLHIYNHAVLIKKQSSQIFYNSLPVSKEEIVKSHYLYNLLLTMISFVLILVIAIFNQDVIYLQAALFIVCMNLSILIMIYPYQVNVDHSTLAVWIMLGIYAFIAMFYFGIYSNRSFPFYENLSWKIPLDYSPLLLTILMVIFWMMSFKKAIQKAKMDKVTIYGGVK
ncbi:ABC-2 transporter permease [Mammaliicoccus stepanovicii]|uniref:Uncharacterized protein n=1 Tax=Mammaliicoccus stepanovicii TaxID=643214 RepID=A0A239YQX6_9STAP|nr:ABC-2 transporter permease [Mammaliicoccus stepanovicii]PNZ73235.1 hypothetical protein CD111_10080 [Mammaliicoccus stepanovicii]GGI42427.1 hypothetical protein GCM10010896_18370 [Mammaliicoccus stepanovicii]SNV61177.1 Uncharacterised protein [Mammaliicoccus stepanovicii]